MLLLLRGPRDATLGCALQSAAAAVRTGVSHEGSTFSQCARAKRKANSPAGDQVVVIPHKVSLGVDSVPGSRSR
jgi:hypothetical protein